MPDPTSRDPQADANRRQRSRRLELLVRDRWLDRGGISSLAKTIGVSRATLYSWLRGDTVPDLDTMSRLADALGLTPSELLALVGEGEPMDAVVELPAPSTPTMLGATPAMSAWDPAWIPPRRRGTRAQAAPEDLHFAYLASPGALAVRRQSPRRHETRLLDVLVGTEVMTADSDEPIGPVVERMYKRAYSQVPVYRGKNLVGMLTADAVARWLGSVQGRRKNSADQATVGEALGLAEYGHAFELVSQDATVHEVAALFDRAMREGSPLSAVLVIAEGGATSKPLGIVTVADLPRLRGFRGAMSG
jgi:predicted transcriptional regulator